MTEISFDEEVGGSNSQDPQRTMTEMSFDEEAGTNEDDPQRTMPVMAFDEEVGHNNGRSRRG